MNTYERLNSILVAEFDRYVMEHPEFAAKIPKDAQIVLQLEGNLEYNNWIKRIAESQRVEGQFVVYVYVNKLKPARSRLVKPLLQEIVER